jgi:hypothetical protein
MLAKGRTCELSAKRQKKRIRVGTADKLNGEDINSQWLSWK